MLVITFNGESVPVSHDQCTQYQDSETEAAKWISVIININIYTFAFPTGTCSLCEKPYCDHYCSVKGTLSLQGTYIWRVCLHD